MTVASDWVTAGAAWRASLTPIGAESPDSQGHQPRVFNLAGMTPAAAARAYNRVLGQRELTVQAVHADHSGARFVNDQGPSGDFPGLTAEQIDGPIPGGPDQLPQPVVPGVEKPKTVVPEGLPDDLNVTQPTDNGGSQTITVVPGTGGQSYDTVITNPDGSTTSSRVVSDGEGGATIWTTLPDGTHSVTYVSAPDADGHSKTENYSYPSSAPQADVAAVTVGDGNGSWDKQAVGPDGATVTSHVEVQSDGVTYNETSPTPDGGSVTVAFRPGSPDFQEPWTVGVRNPDGSGWFNGVTGTQATFGTDTWGQRYAQVYDPVAQQIVTNVVKNGGSGDEWIELIVSDLNGRDEAHYRLLADGRQELLWRRVDGYQLADYQFGAESYEFDGRKVLDDSYVLRRNADGSEQIELDGVVLGTLVTFPDGLTRFTATQELRDRSSSRNGTMKTLVSVEWGPSRKPVTYTDIDGPGSLFRPVAKYTQFGEVPGFPEIGAGQGPFGQGGKSFGDRFGTAYLTLYDSSLPLIGAGGPGRTGVAESWNELGKSLGKSAELAGLVVILGPSGYTLANTGVVPGLNEGEAAEIVGGMADSLGYQDFKQGNISGGLGTLVGGLWGAAGLGKGVSLVIRPARVLGTAAKAGAVGAAKGAGTVVDAILAIGKIEKPKPSARPFEPATGLGSAGIFSAPSKINPPTGGVNAKAVYQANSEINRTLVKVNPRYQEKGTGSAYSANCTSCVVTYEMKRRGKPGAGYVAGPLEAHLRKENGGPGGRQISVLQSLFGGKFKPGNRQTVEGAFAQHGSRGIIYIEWQSGGAHVFSVENVAGVVRFIDSQPTPVLLDASHYFSLGKTAYMRVDDLPTPKSSSLARFMHKIDDQ
ncbi:toxin glutamine deamidase domain-containing protein [Nocardia sp. NPDC055029]